MVLSDIVPTQGSEQWQDVSQPGSLKFGLYVKTHEMKSLEESLQQVVLMPRPQRQEWLTEHQEFVNNLMDSFVTDSVIALDGLNLDSEAMELASEFVTTLRDVTNMIRSIIDTSRTLES
jgi:hypothetical protein